MLRLHTLRKKLKLLALVLRNHRKQLSVIFAMRFDRIPGKRTEF
jgi:hypothetical protein